MVKKAEVERLIETLEDLRKEVNWTERADKPLPADLARGNEEAWRKRCEEGKRRVPELLSKASDMVKRIDWREIEGS